MANGQGITVGRVRVTNRALVSEAGYIRSMRKNMAEIESVLHSYFKNIEGITAQAMLVALQPILDRSQELVPVDSGDLKRSGFIEVRKSVRGPRAVIGYAKHGNPHYAAWVHEMLHIPHAKGKSAKFLEIAVKEKVMKARLELIKYIRVNSGLRGAKAGG